MIAMVLATPVRSKVNTEITQPAPVKMPSGTLRARSPLRSKGNAGRVSGDARESVRDPGRLVVDAGLGVTVYPPEAAGEPCRAVFTENGRRRFRQAATEAGLAVKLAKVTERLAAGAVNAELSGADLIAWYLDPDRLPVKDRSITRTISISLEHSYCVMTTLLCSTITFPPPLSASSRVPAIPARRVALLITQVTIELALQRILDHHLRQPAQQTALPGQLQPPGPRPLRQLPQNLLIRRRQPRPRPEPGGSSHQSLVSLPVRSYTVEITVPPGQQPRSCMRSRSACELVFADGAVLAGRQARCLRDSAGRCWGRCFVSVAAS